MKLDLAIDRGNGSVKWLAHLEDGRNFCGKFASMILQNRGKADPVSVDGVEWLYGANTRKVGLSLAIRPSETGAQGKIDHFAVVLAAVLSELNERVSLGGSVEIENLSIVSPVCNAGLKATYEAEVRGRKFAINGQSLKVKVKSISVFPEASVILQKSDADIVLDAGYGTCLGSVRGIDGYVSVLENGAEQILTGILGDPRFISKIDTQNGKSLPTVELLAISLASGLTSVRGVDLLPFLADVVPDWFEKNALAMLPKLIRVARENDLSKSALLIGGGTELLRLSLGDRAEDWAIAHGCILADSSDFASVQTLGELWTVKQPVGA